MSSSAAIAWSRECPPLICEAWPLNVYTFGHFAILHYGQPLRFTRLAQRKPLALLKVLIALGGRAVPAVDSAD